MTKINEQLSELAMETMVKMKEDDFETNDIQSLADAVKLIESVKELKMKPYLIQWELNLWLPIREYIEDALKILGYEYIGNMDLSDGYNFECENDVHEILFRFKNINCDYTNKLKFDCLEKIGNSSN